MALFFDQDWFDTRLRACGLTRDDVASDLRLTRDEIDEIWKDQREISVNEVTMLARLLKVPASDVATHAGVATPTPPSGVAAGPAADVSVLMNKLEEMDQRLGRMERAIAELQSMIIATRPLG